MDSIRVGQLKGYIKAAGKSIKEFSDEVGFAESTFYRKTNEDGSGFTVNEAQKIVEILALTKEQKLSLFF